jgi:hypothetical protein
LKTPGDLACSIVVFSLFSLSHSDSEFSQDLASFGFLPSVILKHAFDFVVSDSVLLLLLNPITEFLQITTNTEMQELDEQLETISLRTPQSNDHKLNSGCTHSFQIEVESLTT